MALLTGTVMNITYHIDDNYGVFAEAAGTFIKVGLI